MTLAQLRKRALGRYGLTGAYLGAEDSLFPLPLVADVLNEKHRALAEWTRCYRETQTYTIPVSSSGLSTVSLNCNLIEIVPGTVRAYQGSVWGDLLPQAEYAQRGTYGPFEQLSTGTALYYYPRVGSAVGGQRVLELAPGVTTAITNGLKLDAYVYPGNLTAETDAPALQVAEHPVLLKLCCWALAEIELSRGRADAPLAYWQAEAMREAEELRRVIDGFKNPGYRRVVYDEAWD